MSTFYRQGYQESYQDRSKGDFSTAEKFYDLQQSHRRYEQLLEENVLLKQQIQRSRYQERPSYDKCQNCNHHQMSNMDQNSDLVLWNMLERNKFLQQKIDKLKNQYVKQSRTINSIRSSQKWKNRFTCSPHNNTCYEDKYLQLLRVRSPFY